MVTLPFHIARRYVFARKSHKAVNIISMISLFGFCIGTAALIIVLSVFNGFKGMVTDMYSQFDPDLKVVPTVGKSFVLQDDIEAYLQHSPNVQSYSKVLQEQALVRYDGKQTTAIIKGVSEQYAAVNGIDSLFLEGVYNIKKQHNKGAAIGMGLANTLGMGLKFVSSLIIDAPQRTRRISLSNPEHNFKSDYFFPTGFFAVYQPEIDNQYIIIDLAQAQNLFQYEKQISALEIHVSAEAKLLEVQRELQNLLSDDYKVLTRLQQKADLYKMFSMEKWISFFVVLFILIIAIFNIVGTLSMLILEKKKDIQTLLSIGADARFVRKIFYYEGLLIALFGACLGIIFGVFACWLQQQYGIIQLGTNGHFLIDAYPVKVLSRDIILVFSTVAVIGSVSVYFPVNFICKRFNI